MTTIHAYTNDQVILIALTWSTATSAPAGTPEDPAASAAVRNYLLSAPRLALMTWARQVLRRARPDPRGLGLRARGGRVRWS